MRRFPRPEAGGWQMTGSGTRLRRCLEAMCPPRATGAHKRPPYGAQPSLVWERRPFSCAPPGAAALPPRSSSRGACRPWWRRFLAAVVDACIVGTVAHVVELAGLFQRSATVPSLLPGSYHPFRLIGPSLLAWCAALVRSSLCLYGRLTPWADSRDDGRCPSLPRMPHRREPRLLASFLAPSGRCPFDAAAQPPVPRRLSLTALRLTTAGLA